MAGPELNEDWVDKATKKRVLFLMSNIGTSTFEEIKTHLLAHRPEFKKTQLTAYWTRSSVGLKLLLDPCRPQMCTVSFRKDFPNNWNHTMVAAHAVVLKLVFRLHESRYMEGVCESVLVRLLGFLHALSIESHWHNVVFIFFSTTSKVSLHISIVFVCFSLSLSLSPSLSLSLSLSPLLCVLCAYIGLVHDVEVCTMPRP